MRDHEALRAQLLVALTLGLGGCTDGKPEVEPDAAGANRAREPTPPDPGKDEGPREGKAGMAELVGKIQADAEREHSADGDGIPKSDVDPVSHCGSPQLTVTVKDADAGRYGPDDTLGCATSTAAVSVSGMANFTIDQTATQGLRDAGNTEHCCYRIMRPRRGRPLLADGRLLLPAFEIGPRSDSMTSDGPLRVAAAWLQDARLEWASVTSFERAARELRRLDAPRDLCDRYDHAADDERRHAAACLRVAEQVAGRSLRLSSMPAHPARSGDLSACLRRTFTEGCIAETAAALVAMRSARSARPDIARLLRSIADDEANHAALAWNTIGWGLGRCTAQERAAWLRWARRQRPSASHRTDDPDVLYGRLSPASERAIEAEAWTRCIEPLLDAVGHASVAPGADTTRGSASA